MSWGFAKGAVLRYELTHAMQLDLGARGRTEQTMVLETSMLVQAVDGGVATLEATFDRIKVHSPEVEYDSQRGDRPATGVGRTLAALIGKSCQVKIENTGRIVGVEGVSAIMLDSLKAGGVDVVAPSHHDLPLDDEQLAAMLAMVVPRLPGAPVAERATWESEGALSLPRLGELAVKTRAKATAITERTVSFKTRAALETRGTDPDAHGVAAIWDASTAGTATWNVRERRLEEATATAKIVAEAHGEEFEILISTSSRWLPGK